MKKRSFSISVLCIVFVACLIVPYFLPSDIEQGSGSEQSVFGPTLAHWFGTDLLGRDFLSRTLVGGKMTLTISLVTALVSLLIGILLSLARTVFPFVDRLFSPILNLFYAIPTLLVLIFISLLFKEKETGIILALSLEGIFIAYQVLNSDIQRLEAKSFIHASLLLGTSRATIFWKHYFPHMTASLKSLFLLLVPLNILNESFLGFLGLGIMPPDTSWGCLLNEGWKGFLNYPHLIFFPGALLFLTMLAFYWLRDLKMKAYE